MTSLIYAESNTHILMSVSVRLPLRSAHECKIILQLLFHKIWYTLYDPSVSRYFVYSYAKI